MKRIFRPIPLVLIAMLCLTACSFAAEQRTYTATIRQADYVPSGSVTEMLDRIRPTVVDVSSRSSTAAAAGSGVIVSGTADENGADGGQYFIVTNHHVIEGGTQFSVRVLTIGDDGKESTTNYSAELVGSSFRRDIAVLSVRTDKQLATASFVADSDAVKVGTSVYAIGNPLGILGGTVTHGIVSANKRDVSVEGIGVMTLMQTDASINGGNSGGGLFDENGLLVGIINSGYDSYNGTAVEGLNFAIPANDAKYAATTLIATHEERDGKVTRYGYIEGDAQIDLSFSTGDVYDTAALSSHKTQLLATATGRDSILYGTWASDVKAVTGISVNGVDTDLSSGSASDLLAAANALIADVKANDSIVIRYFDTAETTLGMGLFGGRVRYLTGIERTVSIRAPQYVYEP